MTSEWIVGKITKSLTQIKDLAAIFQSVTVACALIVGGIWALYTFGALGQVQRAGAELTLVEQQIRQQAAIEIEIVIERLEVGTQQRRVVVAEVKVKNVGTRNARLEYPEKLPFAARLVSFDEDSRIKYGEAIQAGIPWTRDPNVLSRGGLIRVGTAQVYPFVVTLPGPGLYFLTYHTQVSGAEVEFGESGLPEGTVSFWEGRKYVVVE